MTRRTFVIVAIALAVALVGTVGVAVVATGDGSEGRGGNFMAHLQRLGGHLHGGGHHRGHMGDLIEQLELTPDQVRRLEKIHEVLGTHGSSKPGEMQELHDRLVAQFERGRVESDEIHRLIDDHVEQMRQTAYAVTDEMVALINGLDEKQRVTLLEHLQAADEGHRGH